jgi:hypothetical protein
MIRAQELDRYVVLMRCIGNSIQAVSVEAESFYQAHSYAQWEYPSRTVVKVSKVRVEWDEPDEK